MKHLILAFLLLIPVHATSCKGLTPTEQATVDQIALTDPQAAAEKEVELLEGKAKAWTGLVGSIIPGAAPLLDLLVLPAVGLLAKRPRQNLVKAVKQTTKGDLKAAALSAASIVGWTHTSSDPRQLLAVARAKAIQANDTALAQMIQGLIDQLPTVTPGA